MNPKQLEKVIEDMKMREKLKQVDWVKIQQRMEENSETEKTDAPPILDAL